MPHRILYIDDEPILSESFSFLAQRDGFLVDYADSAAAGLTACLANTPDLVLLDVGLPDANGFELFKSIRGRLPRLPIIFLTARAEEIDRIIGLEMGADDYIPKPFNSREVLARVRAVLRRSNQSTDADLPSVGTGLCLNLSQRRVWLDGDEITLSCTEFNILEALSQDPGRVWTRSRLLDYAWEDPSACYDRVIDTHIKTLRQKFTPKDLIHTHRGVGYSLAPTQATKRIQ